MSSFIYFLPGFVKQSATPDDLRGIGLDHAIGELGIDSNYHTANGPDGAGICVVMASHAGNNLPANYVPDKQTWRKHSGGKFWVGMWNDDQPGPDYLKRGKIIPGHAVHLRDGNDWVVPVTLALMGRTTLPRKLMLGDDGKWTTGILGEYEQLCRDGERIFDLMRAGGSFNMAIDEVGAIITRALSVNYRVGPVELAMLDLFSEQEALTIMESLIDLPTARKLQIEQESDSKNSVAVGSQQPAGPTAI